MPVYEEKKKVNGKTRYYIRTYIIDEMGIKRQITRHNIEWVGREGYWKAQQEEIRLRNIKKANQYENITLDELFQLYCNDKETKLKQPSLNRYKNIYNTHIKPCLGSNKVFELTNKDIMDFHKIIDGKKNNIVSKNSKRKCSEYLLSISFKQSIHSTLASILNFGCKYIQLEKNVASIVGNFKMQKGENKNKLNFLTNDEFKKFILCESNNIYKDFFTVLFYTGMRRGELLALTVDDIDWEKNEISINKSINPKEGLECTTPKTNCSNRKIKMMNIIKKVLSKYKNNSSEVFGINNIKLTTLQRKCDKNCKLANINKNIRIHDFRHSFASLCIYSGVPIEIISKYLGHENISTTLNIYSHLYPNSQDKLIEILNKQDQKQDQEK